MTEKIPNSYQVQENANPHFISPRLLEALGGIKEETSVGSLVEKGAYLWGAEDRDKGKGIFNHVLLASRVAYNLITKLKEKSPAKYGHVSDRLVVEATILHDITKLYGEDREKLSPEAKSTLGITPDFKEISAEVDNVGIAWLKESGFPPEVYGAIAGHDFPEKIVDDPYWKIVLVADYMTGQQVMTVEDRLNDVKTRWIDQQIAKGEAPRIDPERFSLAQDNILRVVNEIFTAIGQSDVEFITENKLNSDESETRWEKFLRSTRSAGKESRAKKLAGRFLAE